MAINGLAMTRISDFWCACFAYAFYLSGQFPYFCRVEWYTTAEHGNTIIWFIISVPAAFPARPLCRASR